MHVRVFFGVEKAKKRKGEVQGGLHMTEAFVNWKLKPVWSGYPKKFSAFRPSFLRGGRQLQFHQRQFRCWISRHCSHSLLPEKKGTSGDPTGWADCCFLKPSIASAEYRIVERALKNHRARPPIHFFSDIEVELMLEIPANLPGAASQQFTLTSRQPFFFSFSLPHPRSKRTIAFDRILEPFRYVSKQQLWKKVYISFLFFLERVFGERLMRSNRTEPLVLAKRTRAHNNDRARGAYMEGFFFFRKESSFLSPLFPLVWSSESSPAVTRN